MFRGASKARRNLPSCFFIQFFVVSVTPSIDTPGSSNDFIISIKPFIFSFQINKANIFPSLTASFAIIFQSNLIIALEVKLLTNPGKLPLAKQIATFFSASFP